MKAASMSSAFSALAVITLVSAGCVSWSTVPRAGSMGTGSDTPAERTDQTEVLPGQPLPTDGVTISSHAPPVGVATSIEPEPPPRVTLSGRVKSVGPFEARQAGQGAWYEVGLSGGGVETVQMPPALAVRAAPLNVNVGVSIKVTGAWVELDKKRFLRADSVTRLK